MSTLEDITFYVMIVAVTYIYYKYAQHYEPIRRYSYTIPVYASIPMASQDSTIGIQGFSLYGPIIP